MQKLLQVHRPQKKKQAASWFWPADKFANPLFSKEMSLTL